MKAKPIQEGEMCPNCGTDISTVGNGCNIEVIEESRLVELRRKCYSCLNEWVVDSEADSNNEAPD